MKNFSNILWIVGVLFFCASCYDDKNDYNYTERENIEVQWEESYSRIGYNSMLEIDPQLTPKDEYEYTWRLDQDTISTDPVLAWPVNVPEGSYQLSLWVKSKTDGLPRTFYTRLFVTTYFSDGWLLAKTIDGQTDMDFVRSSSDKVEDVLLHRVGHRMEGVRGNVTVAPGVTFVSPITEEKATQNLCWLGSTKDAWVITLSDMTFQRDYATMFYDGEPDGMPLLCTYKGYGGACLLRKNSVYWLSSQGPTDWKYIPKILPDKQEPEFANSVVQCANVFYFYDQRNQRFLFGDGNCNIFAFVSERKDGMLPPVDVNHTGCRLCYMGVNKFYCTSSDAPAWDMNRTTYGNFYAVMKDDISHYIYTVSVAANVWSAPYYNPIEAVVEMKSEKVKEATRFAIHSSLPFIYYNDASGNMVHSYDILAGMERPNVITFPAGEKITFMKALYFDRMRYLDNSEDVFDKFVVATVQDGHYKVYFYDMDGYAPDTSKQPEVFEGVGEVTSISRICKTIGTGTQYTSGNFGLGDFE